MSKNRKSTQLGRIYGREKFSILKIINLSFKNFWPSNGPNSLGKIFDFESY